VWACRRLLMVTNFAFSSLGNLAMLEKVILRCLRLMRRRVAGAFGLVRILLLGTSLLLGACTEGDTGRKDRPVIYGSAGGDGGGGGATSAMSFSW
jgi:hypothetical protein